MISSFFKERSLLDKLKYWDLRSGIVFLTDGTIEFAISFQLPSSLMRSSDGIHHFSRSMAALTQQAIPEGGRARIYVESSTAGPDMIAPYTELNIENEFLAAIHQEDVEQLNQNRLEGYLQNWNFTLTVSIPPAKARKDMSYTEQEIARILNDVKQKRIRLVSLMQSAEINPRELNSQETFEFMWRWWNPGLCSSKPPKYKPFTGTIKHKPEHLKTDPTIQYPTFKRQLINSEIDNTDPAYMVVDNRYVTTISMQHLPEISYAGISENIIRNLGGYHFYVVIDLMHLKQGNARRDLTRKNRQMIVNSQEGVGGIADPANAAMADELTDLLQHLEITGDHIFKLGLSVVVFARSKKELEEAREQAMRGFSEMSAMSPVVGGHPNITLYTESLAPCHGLNNPYCTEVVGSYAANFFPVAAPWKGSDEPVMVFPNRWGTITQINPLDDRATAWNTLIAASTGRGKTFLTQKILTGCLWLGAKLIIVDQGQSYYSLVEGSGGSTIVLKPAGSIMLSTNQDTQSINPFDLPDGQAFPDADKKIFLLAFLRILCPESNEDRGIENAIFTAAIEQMYTRFLRSHQGPDGQPVYTYTGGARLSELVFTLRNLQSIGSFGVRDGDNISRIAELLAIKLQDFCGDTPYGQMFDRPTNVDLNNDIMYFDAKAIKDDKTLTSISLLLIADLVWKKAKENPWDLKVAVFEEFGVLSKIPEAARFVAELFRTARTYKLACIGISQSFKDFERVEGIITNTNFTYAGPVDGENDFTIDYLGLTDEGAEHYKSLKSVKRKYSEFLTLIRTDAGIEGDVIRVQVGPIAYWSYTSDNTDKERRYKALQKTNGNIAEAVKMLAQGLA